MTQTPEYPPWVRARLWDVLLKVVLAGFIPISIGLGGGLVAMYRQVAINQTVIATNQTTIKEQHNRIQSLEDIARIGPRFTPEMNETADYRVKEWARDRFVPIQALDNIDAKLTAITVQQKAIQEDVGELRELAAASRAADEFRNGFSDR